MPSRHARFLVGLVAVTTTAACGASRPSRDDHEHDHKARTAAIARAVPLMQHSQEVWIGERECFSCHHQSLGLIALELARDSGSAIDETRFAAQRANVLDSLEASTTREELAIGKHFINGQVGISYGASALAITGTQRGRWSDTVAHYVAGKQAPDGRWPSESHRPPLEDSSITATAWALRTLSVLAPRGRADELAARVSRAVAFLERATPRDTEDRASQLLGLRWGGAPLRVRAPLAAALLAEQHTDGGWSQLPTRASDAYATGQTLVALHIAGELAISSDAYQRGIAFLVRTQQHDGSWHVVTRRKGPGLPYFETGFPHGIDQFISFSGTAWAVAALALADDPRDGAALLRTAEAAPPPSPDLIDTVLFGSLDALRVAVQQLDPQSADARVAAMAAAFDADRLQLFLDRGFAVDLHDRDGYDLLSIAADYSGALPAVKLLLARGADPRTIPPDDVSPIERAAGRGELDEVRALLDAGAPLRFSFGVATATGDTALLTFLLDHEAPISGPEFADGSEVAFAVRDRDLPRLQLLLAHGATVDDRDAQGRTALHWAAIVDAGTTAFVDALLQAGADPSARTPKGETAEMLAVQHGNRHLLQRLHAQGATLRR